jgi:AcrR family transcriptional regulator
MVLAGELLLDGRDPLGLSMDELLARAGASASSFYQRFGSKEQYWDHLHQRFCERMEAEFALRTDPASYAEKSLEEAAAEGSAAYLAFRRKHAGPLLSFEQLEAQTPHLRERHRRIDRAALERLRSCLGGLRTRDGRAPQMERVALALDLAVSTFRGAADGAGRVHARQAVPDDELVQQVMGAVLVYLVG